MNVKRVVVGELETNCYIVSDKNKCLIIDPGADYLKIIKNVTEEVVGILITHNHFDHIGAKEELMNHYNVKCYDFFNLKEGLAEISDFKFQVIHTPGHTSDSITYFFNEMMFVGDFIFKGSIGRTDLDTGNYNDMLKSIDKIKKYEDNIVIYPGHYNETTLSQEIKSNPFFK